MSLVKYGSKALSNTSASGQVGKGMVMAGGGGLGLMLLAGMLPLITFPVLCIILVVLGLFMWE